MENRYLLRIEGKDPKRFIKNLITLQIDLLKITEYKDHFEILVNEKYYNKVMSVKTIYEVKLIKVMGPKAIILMLNKGKIFAFSLLLGVILLFLLSNIIFEVEVIHIKTEVRDLVKEELSNYGIKHLKFCVSFKKKEQIRSDILKKHKDKLEWLEIERIGTKYIIRVEERKLNKEQKSYEEQNIIAKKDGFITSIEAENGEVVVKKNQYVKKGDVLITGVIKNKDVTKKLIQAKGKVKAETWYKVTVTVPLHYHEEKLTGKSKNTISIKFLDKKIPLFDFSPYKNSKTEDTTIIKNKLLPVSLLYQKEEELLIIDRTYTKEEAILKAKEIAVDKVLSTLSVNDRLIWQKDLKIIQEDSKMIVEVFLKMEEDITEYAKIPEEEKLSPIE